MAPAGTRIVGPPGICTMVPVGGISSLGVADGAAGGTAGGGTAGNAACRRGGCSSSGCKATTSLRVDDASVLSLSFF